MTRKGTLLMLAASVGLAFLPKILPNTLSQASGTHFPVRIADTEAEAGEGEDDPIQRFLWEQMRTADPATGQVPEDIRSKELAFARTLPRAYMAGGHYKNGDGWQNIGPYNVGGRTRALALDANNESIILAGGATGGMWRSIDAGKTWNRTSVPDVLKSVSCLTQDTRPGKSNTWYYGTGEYFGGYIISGDGIFKSIDSCKTWKPVWNSGKANSFQNTDYVWNIAVNKANTSQDEVLAAAYGGIYRSTYGGDSFKLVLGGGTSLLKPSSATDIAITSKGIMYATLSSDGPTGQKGLWRSTDGTHWTNITPDGWPANYNRVVIGIAPSNENTVYFLASTPNYGQKGIRFDNVADWNSFWKYTFVSGDGSGAGGSWENRSDNLPLYSAAKGYVFGDFNSQQGYDLVVKVKPDNENIVFLGGTNIYRSLDGFATKDKITWIGGYNQATDVIQPYDYPNHHPDQHNLVFLPSNSKVLYSACDGGIFRAQNDMDSALNWVSLNNGYINSQFYAIALNHAPDANHAYSDRILGGLQDNQSWSIHVNADPAAPWDKHTRGDGGYCALFDNDTATFMLTSIQNGKIFLDAYDKSGKRLGWNRIEPIGATGYLFINPFALDVSDNRILYQPAGEYIWRNDSLLDIPLAGKNDSIKQGWTRLDVSRIQAQTITAVASGPGHVLYYGTRIGKIFKLTGANTANPVKKDITSKDFLGNMYVNCIAVDPEDANKAIAVFSNYNIRSLFYTDNGGTTWQDISGNLEENANGSGNGPSCRWAKIIHVSGKTLYLVGASTGMYMTDKLNGTSTVWMQDGAESIGNMDVEMIDARSTDGLVVAATYGGGVFSNSAGVLAGVEQKPAGNSGFTLEQNYPNPASDIASIRFSIPAACPVSLQIMDISGKVVYTAPAERMSAGEHTLNVPVANLRKGVYLYRMQAGGQSMTRKMLVIH